MSETGSILDQSYDYGKSPLTPTSTAQSLYIYLFGGHISQSHSPSINSILFRSVGASWTYALCETTSTERFIQFLHQPSCIGASITMPNKVAFMPLLDDLTGEARAIGAVNTVFVRLDHQGRRRYIGTNTDCIGIRETIRNNSPTTTGDTGGRPALVVGAGGAARSAIYALWMWFKPSEIYVVNRLKVETDELISGMRNTVPGIRLHHIADVEQAHRVPAPRVIVGTVPDNQPRERGELVAWQICEAFLRNGGGSGGTVLDMCYHPVWTRLLGLAQRHGWTTMQGTEVLVHVAAAQQLLWLERKPNEEGLRKALESMYRVSKL